MKLIAYYSVYNEADFLMQSLCSVCPHVDKTIIIEGAWKETWEVNGKKRSDDGTLGIIKDFIKTHPDLDIEYYEHNEESQLEQRNVLWNYIQEDCLMLLVDGDEVWEAEQIGALREAASDWPRSGALPAFVYTVESLVFVNDFYTVSRVRYPRLWEIEKGCKYEFVEPNRILVNGLDFDKRDLDVHYFHYSYCHSAERFREKKRERTRLHGSFAWELRDGLVQRDDASIEEFTGPHPVIMQAHPLFGKKRHVTIKPKETIVYVEHSGIGNLVLSTPMLRAIREAKPSAHIHVVTWKRAFRIIEGLDFIDTVIPADLPSQMTQLNKQIDHLLVSPVGALQQVVQWLGTRARRVHNLPPINPWTQHEVERKMLLARKLGFRGVSSSPCVQFFEYNMQKSIEAICGDKLKKTWPKYVTICAGYLREGQWPMKHWGDTKYVELVNHLYENYSDHKIVFCGSEIDRGDADRIIAWAEKVPLDHCINLCGFSEDIKDTAAILAQSVLSIGNDGGLQHIAAACGVPTVTIFTFTNPVKNQPLGGKVVMVPCQHRLSCQHGQWQRCEGNGCLNVPVEKVYEAVQETIGGRNG